VYKIRDVLFVHTLWIQILLAIKIWVVKIEICTFSVVILVKDVPLILFFEWMLCS
jgi:hypothetical protein